MPTKQVRGHKSVRDAHSSFTPVGYNRLGESYRIGSRRYQMPVRGRGYYAPSGAAPPSPTGYYIPLFSGLGW